MHPIRSMALCTAALGAAAVWADRPELARLVGGTLIGDQDLDAIYWSRDRNGDGDANDADETVLYYQSATTNVNTIFQSDSRHAYFGDVEADQVVRLRDLNFDCDAGDAGEAGVWFSNANAGGLAVTSPQGIWEAADGAVYIVNAGTLAIPIDAIYRTVDLNSDGDAEDAGEATLWFDTTSLLVGSTAFEMVFIDDTCYFADSLGGAPDAIYRARDDNGSGTIETGEFNIFIDETSPYGVGIFSALATDNKSLYAIELASGGQTLFRLTDVDNSGTINDPGEVQAVWSEAQVPPGYTLESAFTISVGPGGEMMVGSSGAEIGDNVFRLLDLNGDGDFMDAGETIVWLSGNGAGAPAERVRALCYALPEPGDTNGDADADQADLGTLLAAYGTSAGQPGFDPTCDFDFDGTVGQPDLGILLAAYGYACP